MRFDLVTRASPEQVLQAMTDFTDRRLAIWSTLDPKVYEVRERGETWAVAREGSPHSPYWVVVRYDWSDPRLIRWTELETNHGEGGDGFMRIEPHGSVGSQLHVEWSTRPVHLRDKVAIFLIQHTMGRPIARMWRKDLDRLAVGGRRAAQRGRGHGRTGRCALLSDQGRCHRREPDADIAENRWLAPPSAGCLHRREPDAAEWPSSVAHPAVGDDQRGSLGTLSRDRLGVDQNRTPATWTNSNRGLSRRLRRSGRDH